MFILCALLLATSVEAQPPRLEPKIEIDLRPMPFARSLYWGGAIADTSSTTVAINNGCYEANVIIPRSVREDQENLAAYSMVVTGLLDWGIQRLWKKGKLSRKSTRNIRFVAGGVRLAVGGHNFNRCGT